MGTTPNRWAAMIRASTKPAYLAIADAIADDIAAGRLAAEQRLPPLRALAKHLDLNFTTVSRGYAEAQRRKLIDSQAGRGTFVLPATPAASAVVRSPAAVGLIDMTMNMPPEPQASAIHQMLRNGLGGLREVPDLHALLRYQEFGGGMCDRDAGARWLGERIPEVPSSRVLVVPGVQSALLALFSVLARAGETICCEAVTYPGVKGLAAQLGIRLMGLPCDDQGIDPEAFGAACASLLPKALYCNPTMLNPTTATMSQARREAIVEIARRYSVPIIEDDAYGFLPSAPPTPLAVLAPELTFHVTGFAKCVGAGLRVGYLVAPNTRYTARLSSSLRTSCVMASPITTFLATQWINDGTVKLATDAIREESRARQRIATEVLRRADYSANPEAFHLWLRVPAPWNRIEFSTHLRSSGVGVVVSDAFTVTGPAPEAVRVCLGGVSTQQECRQSLEIIEDALEQLPEVASGVM
ncbi:MAG: GntR family transcriptional regulator [Xanthomonadaceae bacterium]|nr:GntR family transcriptional regulator [Xanthomonadaceae bacterium]